MESGAILQFLLGLPQWTPRAGAMAMFAATLLLAWSLPERFVWNGAPDRARWRDLRLWATGLTLIQFGLYLIF